jgi:hypothetical protein
MIILPRSAIGFSFYRYVFAYAASFTDWRQMRYRLSAISFQPADFVSPKLFAC